MIKSITELIAEIRRHLATWETGNTKVKPWFRGESGNDTPLRPKIYDYKHNEENYLLQSFRRKAGGLANVPARGHTDKWLFLAQHYRVPTRLLDWTEGALHALYFSINKKDVSNPRLYMLNPRRLNEFAGAPTYDLNYPLSFENPIGELYVKEAWQNRNYLKGIINDLDKQLEKEPHNEYFKKEKKQLNIPMALPAIYQDLRMVSQRSCFTIHGYDLNSIKEIFEKNSINTSECLFEYKLDVGERSSFLKELNWLGISAATIFPDLDHFAEDLLFDIKGL